MNDVKAKYCFYCERPFGYPKISLGKPIKKTRDHIIPTSKGGVKSKINIVYACHICNGIKADRTLEQFRHYLQVQQGSSRKKVKADKIEIMIANIDKLIIHIAPFRHTLLSFQDCKTDRYVIPKQKYKKYEPPPVLKGISKEGSDWYKNYYLQNIYETPINFHEESRPSTPLWWRGLNDK